MQMAATVIGADEANLEKLADELSAQVDVEVQVAVNNHPLLAALTAQEVKTPEALQQLITEATDGRAYAEDANKKLRAAAIRRFKDAGVDQSAVDSYVAGYAHVPVAERLRVAEQWENDAPVQTSTTQRGTRQTAPAALSNHAVDV